MSHPIHAEQRTLLTIEEAVLFLGVERRAAYELVLTNQVASIGIGTDRLLQPSAIAEYHRALGRDEILAELGLIDPRADYSPLPPTPSLCPSAPSSAPTTTDSQTGQSH